MTKNIIFDLTSLFKRNITGLESFAIDFYRALLKRKDVNVFPVFRMKNEIDSNPNSIIIKSKNRFLTEQIYLPQIVKSIKGIDYVIYPAFPPGFMTYFVKPRNVKVVTVIHDLVMWKYLDTVSIKAKVYLKPLYELSLKYSDLIITVSNSIKVEIEKLTSIKVILLPGCISEKYDSVESINTDVLKYLNLQKGNYILSVGTIEPRKNITYLLQVYKSLLEKGFDKKLVLVGRQGWEKSKRFRNILNTIKNKVIFIGYISDYDLITLYKNSLAFILLSIHEGFGKPPLEALACGTKVYVSEIPVFKETLNDHAFFLPLNDADKASKIIMETIYKDSPKPINNYSFANFVRNVQSLEL